MSFVSSCNCLCPIPRSQVLSREWKCSWNSTDRRYSNYNWVIKKFIAYEYATYIRGLTIQVFFVFCLIFTSIPSRSWMAAHMLYIHPRYVHGPGNLMMSSRRSYWIPRTKSQTSFWRNNTVLLRCVPIGVSFILHSLWSGSVTVDSGEHIESFTSQSFVEYCHIGCHVFHLIIFQWCNLTRWSWQHNITQVYHRWKKTYKTLLISHLLNHFLHFEIYLRKLPAL